MIKVKFGLVCLLAMALTVPALADEDPTLSIEYENAGPVVEAVVEAMTEDELLSALSMESSVHDHEPQESEMEIAAKALPWVHSESPPYEVQVMGADDSGEMMAMSSGGGEFTVLQTWPSMDANDPESHWLVPDGSITGGPGYLCISYNHGFRVYLRDGTLISTQSFSSFFSELWDGDEEPFNSRVTYDPVEEKYTMATGAHDHLTEESWILLAVSQTSNPLGSWWQWKLQGLHDGGWTDQPRLALDNIPSTAGGAVYISGPIYPFGGGTYITEVCRVLPKSELYSGGYGFAYYELYGFHNEDESPCYQMMPADMMSSSDYMCLVNTAPGSGDFVTIWAIYPSFPPDPPETSMMTVTIGAYSSPANPPQPGSCDDLKIVGTRIHGAMFYDGHLYFGFHSKYNFGGPDVSACRALKVHASTGAVVSNIVFGEAGVSSIYPAVCADEDENMYVIYARVGESVYPSLYVRGNSSTDWEAVYDGETCIYGIVSEPLQYGDYLTIKPDTQNMKRVFGIGEAASASAGYGTYVCEVTYDPPLPPVADFDGNPLIGDEPLSVQYFDGSLNNPTSWWWDFGDGEFGWTQNPQHQYQEEGTYSVQLNVSNGSGFDSELKVDYIEVGNGGDPPMGGGTVIFPLYNIREACE